MLQPALMALMVGVASGAIGAFVILRRMALVGDALSHVALPGIAVALLLHKDPFWGVLVPLVFAAWLIWWLEGRTRVPPDALVGLLFTASLAIGILAIPNEDIVESLFGGFPALSPALLAGILGAAFVLTFLTFRLARKFVFLAVAPDLARVDGIGRRYDFALLIVFALVVALGIKLVGTLLMGALTIIPAAIAKNVCRSMRAFMVTATLLGGGIATIGLIGAKSLGLLPGPSIILIGVALFLLSLLLPSARAHWRRG
jgi:ABC-type Mn2+/Zn2+ transport system permease subunit